MPVKSKKKEEPSFWATLPGVLTGLGALLTAIAAIVGALKGAGTIGGADSRSEAADKPAKQVVVTQQQSQGFFRELSLEQLKKLKGIHAQFSDDRAEFAASLQNNHDRPVAAITVAVSWLSTTQGADAKGVVNVLLERQGAVSTVGPGETATFKGTAPIEIPKVIKLYSWAIVSATGLEGPMAR